MKKKNGKIQVTIRLIELGLTREKVDSYIRFHSNKYSSALIHYKNGKIIKRKRLFKKLLKIIPISFIFVITLIYFLKTSLIIIKELY